MAFVSTVIALALSALKFAVVFWGSVRLLGGRIPENKFSLALFFGVLFAVFGLLPGSFILGIIPLAAILMLLINYFQVGVLRSMAVITILIITDLAWAALVISSKLHAATHP